MTDDEILQLASETSGAHYMDHSHVLRFARAVIDKATTAERDVMEQALDALQQAADIAYSDSLVAKFNSAIEALRAALGDADAA
jgi:hypothetical protein